MIPSELPASGPPLLKLFAIATKKGTEDSTHKSQKMQNDSSQQTREKKTSEARTKIHFSSKKDLTWVEIPWKLRKIKIPPRESVLVAAGISTNFLTEV